MVKPKKVFKVAGPVLVVEGDYAKQNPEVHSAVGEADVWELRRDLDIPEESKNIQLVLSDKATMNSMRVRVYWKSYQKLASILMKVRRAGSGRCYSNDLGIRTAQQIVKQYKLKSGGKSVRMHMTVLYW